jgi:hypothetical protein
MGVSGKRAATEGELMVYRRRDNKTGTLRPGWTFMARTETGWKQMGTRTDNKTLAGKIEGMWETLAKEHRAWDILGRVMAQCSRPSRGHPGRG